MTKKDIIYILEQNIIASENFLKEPRHSQKCRNNLKGLIDGYEFAIILLKKKNND